MKNIELKDFLDFKYLNNIKVRKDTIAFCTTTCDEEKNKYNNNLYLLKNNQTIQLTNTNSESSFDFINDNEIIFSSIRDAETLEKKKNHEEITDFYTININGGEATKIFSLPLNVFKIEVLENNNYLLSVLYDLNYSAMYLDKDKSATLNRIKEDLDYEVYDNIPFYSNAQGYYHSKITKLFIYNSDTKTIEEVTSNDISVGYYEVKDNNLLYVASKNLKRPSLKDGIYLYDFNSKTTKTLIEEKDYSIMSAHMIADKIMFLGNKETTHGDNENVKFFVLDKDVTLVNPYGDSLWNSVGSDARYGGGRSLKVVNDKLYFITTIVDSSLIKSIDLNGHIEDVLTINGSVDCYDTNEKELFFIGMIDNKLQEIYNQDLKALTKINTTLDDKYVADYHPLDFKNDGIDFRGWVLLPKDYDPNKKYPAILDIHGGPKTVYGEVYYHEMQVWANMGYIVFFTNPRGSDGRGNDFMDIFGKYGTIDFDDLMVFTDEVIKGYPSIDTSRIGVTGGSYGGFMSNWIITHTDRFACAATQRSISNWISFYGTSDIGFNFAEDQIHGNIFDNPEKLWEHSPLKYAKNVKTPTLFIHSNEDYRCPLEQGMQLFTALVDLGVETKFVMFKGENHELSRSGLPKHRVKRLTEITNWMEKYLK